MHISIRNNRNFDREDFERISEFLVTKQFRQIVENDSKYRYEQEETRPRNILEPIKGVFFIRVLDMSADKHDIAHEVYLSSTERYGLIDLFQVGTDANKVSSLYWIAVPKAKYVMATSLGIFCRAAETTTTGTAALLGRFDKLWIGGNKNSTTLIVDSGSSHMQT
ncbi:hypothetical protein EVB87_212 [Rhizobium phage RHph_N28_1]|nr:hypothetical protein EVB87_212 [Rhizobium phage RHph_N28_1]QIG74241.1 hypothetical protein EVC07_213 [Rhizobium phage RHph_N42]QIG74851.1 hypothetical protein EVC12_216 [Rhizobium phage RHph_I42]QXV73901.1 hypothetical protein [Rhizobium phage RHph_N46]